MNKILQLVIFTWVICLLNSAHSSCLLISDGAKILIQEGDGDIKQAPACTFNIVLSLMGFAEKILIDETHPVLLYNSQYNATRPELKHDHDPTSWMQNSAVWYGQVLAQILGIDTVKEISLCLEVWKSRSFRLHSRTARLTAFLDFKLVKNFTCSTTIFFRRSCLLKILGS